MYSSFLWTVSSLGFKDRSKEKMASNKFSPAFLEKKDENGSRFVERMMTTVAALKQQSRNVLQYLIAACNAHIKGEDAPSLLPIPKA